MENEYLHQDDQLLISSIRNGNEESFALLFKKYYPMLCAYGSRFVELEDAEECVQDALLWLWENREVLVIQSSLSNYLFAIVHHRAISRIRQLEAKSRAETYFYEEMQDLITDVDFYCLHELSRRIRQALDNLPPAYREAFVMHRFKNMTYKEIASLLNVSPKTVDYRIQQTLKLLRIELKDYLPLLAYLFIQQ